MTTSNDKVVARAIKSLVREDRTLFESSDSHALSEFIAEYLCVDDPADSDGELVISIVDGHYRINFFIEQQKNEIFPNLKGMNCNNDKIVHSIKVTVIHDRATYC